MYATGKWRPGMTHTEGIKIFSRQATFNGYGGFLVGWLPSLRENDVLDACEVALKSTKKRKHQ